MNNQLSLYHGTTVAASSPISLQSLKDSVTGRLGPGVYGTNDVAVARAISQYKNQQQGDVSVVIKFTATVQKVYDCQGQTDVVGSWKQKGYDAATGQHPAWVVPKAFQEWVVSESSVKIVAIELVNGTYKGEFSFDGDLYVGGNVTLEGSIKCNTMNIGGLMQ